MTMKEAETARGIAERFADQFAMPDEGAIREGAAKIEAALTAARRQGVREGVEMAARAATSFLVGDPHNGIPLRSPTPHQIADRIRSLTGGNGHG